MPAHPDAARCGPSGQGHGHGSGDVERGSVDVNGRRCCDVSDAQGVANGPHPRVDPERRSHCAVRVARSGTFSCAGHLDRERSTAGGTDERHGSQGEDADGELGTRVALHRATPMTCDGAPCESRPFAESVRPSD